MGMGEELLYPFNILHFHLPHHVSLCSPSHKFSQPSLGDLMKASLLKLDWLIKPLSLVVELTHRGQGVTTSSNCLTMWVCPCQAVPSLKTPCEYEFGCGWNIINTDTHYPGSPNRISSMPGTGNKNQIWVSPFQTYKHREMSSFLPVAFISNE